MINARALIGKYDLLFITLDSLRYDAACRALADNLTPNLAARLPARKWQERHTPGNFTYAAHQAFFTGFLPTPAAPGKHPRLFAAHFQGSETTTAETAVFDAADIVTGLAQLNYHTVCIGGVGFFNKQSPLGNELPKLFLESHWSPELGVTDPHSTAHQVNLAISIIARLTAARRLFLFINVSAIHQPNKIFLPGAAEDSLATQIAALAYVDKHLGRLFNYIEQRAATLVIICSDHGTAYGEDNYYGHRISHPTVWTVPYAEFLLEARP
jgi:hypothetical protein